MLVLTGPGGFVGSQLMPRLAARRAGEMLLVSRNPDGLRAQFPGLPCCRYEDLAGVDLAGSVFIHMAARNNDRGGELADFRAANVDHLLETAALARGAGALRFINLCSVRALAPEARDLYGVTKREGAERLAAFWPEGAINLYLPAVYGSRFQGRLAPLGRLPASVRAPAIGLSRQVKPMLSIDTLEQVLEPLIRPGAPAEGGGAHAAEWAADPVPRWGLYNGIKRLIDVTAAVTVLALLGWAMVVIALFVRLDTRGPAIFAQRRVGRGGRAFTCYKFRTMAVGTAQLPSHDMNGAAITRVGRFLRRTKLDELPQVANILRNEMSLVGPRPSLPSQVELVQQRAERGVLELKPGITGLAQVNDIDMSDPARLAAWDARYAAFRTMTLDIGILLKTVLGHGKGDRVANAVER